MTDNKKTSAAKTAKTETQDSSQKIRIKIKAFDHKIIDQSTRTIINTATRSGASVFGPIPLPTEKKKYTTNRSTFVHKNARDQYEMRTHKRIIDIHEANPRTIEALNRLVVPAGVFVKIRV